MSLFRRRSLLRTLCTAALPVTAVAFLAAAAPSAMALDYTWTGAGGNTSWSTPGNWTVDVAGTPEAAEDAPGNGADVNIPACADVQGDDAFNDAVVITGVPAATLASLSSDDAFMDGCAPQSLTGSGATLAAHEMNLRAAQFHNVALSLPSEDDTAYLMADDDGNPVGFLDGTTLSAGETTQINARALGMSDDASIDTDGELVMSAGNMVTGEPGSSVTVGATGGVFFGDDGASSIVFDTALTSHTQISVYADTHITGGASASITMTNPEAEGDFVPFFLGAGATLTNLPVTIGEGSKLTGNGTLSKLTVSENGNVRPSTEEGDAGILHVSGDFGLEAGGTLDIMYNGSGAAGEADGFSEVVVDGTATLDEDAYLFEDVNAVPTEGSKYVGLVASTITGKPMIFDSEWDATYGEAAIVLDEAQLLQVTHHIASASVASNTTVAGGSFAVSGAGFIHSEPVTVLVPDPNAQNSGVLPIAKATTAASNAGAVSTSVTIPALTPAGDYFVVVSGDTSGAVIQLPVKVTKPATTTPVDPDTDGDGLKDSVDCNKTDKNKPLQTKGAVDKDCNGVDDAIQPIKFVGTGTKNDKVVGQNGPDVIKTGAGNDTVKSGGGKDNVDGGAGNDNLDGGAGDDQVSGGTGNDKVKGGSGKDKLSGGSGNDNMDAKDGKAGDTVSCGAGKDTVIADKKDKVGKDCEKVIRK